MVGLKKHNLQEVSKDSLSVKSLWSLPVLHHSRQKIVEALKHEPFLTTKQIARLFYAVSRTGEPAKSFQIRPRKTTVYTLVPGYYSAYRLLKRMFKDGFIAKHRPDFRGEPDLWSLPKKRTPKNWYSRNHEMDCADLFVSLVKSKQLLHWDNSWSVDEETFARHKAFYDRRFELEGLRQVVFLEVDRGTEDLDTIAHKVRKYSDLATANPKDPFIVVFTVQGYRWTDQRARADALLGVFANARKGNQFLVTPHEAFLSDPLSKCLIPYYNDKISLSLYETD